MRSIINALIVLSLFSCSDRIATDRVVARFDRKLIMQSQIDSILAVDIYKIRMNTIRNLIDLEIIREEAYSQNTPVETFLKLNYLSNIFKVTENGILTKVTGRYSEIGQMNSNSNYDSEAQFRSESLLNVLRNKYQLEILLPSPSFQYQAFNNMYSYNWPVPNASEFIFVLFNYDCSVCILNDKLIREIGQEFQKNIKYIYYTKYVTMYALLCDAAMMQDHFWEMHDRVISSGCTENINSLMGFADSLGMDTLELVKDMNDKRVLKKHLANSQIIQNMDILSVPVYIYQNSFYYDIQTLVMGLQTH